MEQKRVLWALNLTSYNARDYFDGKCCDCYTEMFLFATSEEAKAFAMGIDVDSDSYNECMLFHGDLTEEEILDVSGFEEMADFEEALREPYSTNPRRKNYGEDEKKAVAAFIQQEYDETLEDIECANYDFNKSIEGSIIVVWAWEKHIGYAREFKELRYAWHDETERMLAKEDRTFVPQVDVVMTKEEVESSADLKAELTKRLLGSSDRWKWTRPGHVESAIEEIV